ncbi:hypothetical protein WDZ92_36425, partial [Nostoc sp. NIES-2111]
PAWKAYEWASRTLRKRGKAGGGSRRRPIKVSQLTRLRRAIWAIPELGIYTVPLPNRRFLEARRKRIQTLAERGIVARLHSDGPFEPIAKLEMAFGASATRPPSLLALGDSVFYRVSRTDRDQTSLGGMLEDRFPAQALAIAGSAFHPRVYLALLRVLAKLPHHPRKLVLPVNMRCFSPQWGLRPDYAYTREIAAAEAHRAGDPAPETRFPSPSEREEALARMLDTPVSFPDSPLSSFGAFAELVAASPSGREAKAWRERQIAIFHYLYPLEPDHPWLIDLKACIALAGELGIRPLVYITPVNRDWGAKAAPDIFAARFAANVETCLGVLAPDVQAAHGCLLDWSRAFGAGEFFNPDEKTEHLCEQGRRRLVGMIADELSQMDAAKAVDAAPA